MKVKTFDERVKALEQHEYFVGPRNNAGDPLFEGSFMVSDSIDADGYCIVGNNLDELVNEAFDFLLPEEI